MLVRTCMLTSKRSSKIRVIESNLLGALMIYKEFPSLQTYLIRVANLEVTWRISLNICDLRKKISLNMCVV